MRSRLLSAIPALALFAFLVGVPALSARDKDKEAASPPAAKAAASETQIKAIRKDFSSTRWVVRAFAALEAMKYDNLQVLSRLSKQWRKEADTKVKAFIIHAMATWESDDLLLMLDEPFLSQQFKALETAQNEFDGDAVVELLNSLFKTKNPKDVKKWTAFWKTESKSFQRKHEQAVKRYITKNGAVPEDADGEVTEEASCVPTRLDEALRKLEKNGVDMAILLDDTGSMGNTIQAAKDGIKALMGAMQVISPDYFVGMVTYKDAVNDTIAMTQDMEAMQHFIDGLKADGGDDIEEAAEKAFDHAMTKFEWREPATKMLVIVGDAPIHDKDKPEFLQRIDEAAAKGYSLHTIVVPLDKTPNPDAVKHFQEFAEHGSGASVILKDHAKLLTEMLTLMFGKEYKDYTAEFCECLVGIMQTVKPAK